MNRIQINSEGWQIWWEAAKVERSVVRQACEQHAGLGDIVPLFDPITCLKDICNTLVKETGLFRRGQPIEPRQLSRDVYGVTAVREIKGKTRNEYRHLFSLGCTGTNIDDFEVKIWDVAEGDETKEIRDKLTHYDKFARGLWDLEKDFMPAKQLTEVCRRLVFHYNGVMIKKNGGLYFLPNDHFPVFEQIASDIEKSGSEVEFTFGCFDCTANPRMMARILSGLSEEITLETGRMRDDVAVLANGSKKMRRNGIERRMKDIQGWLSKVEYYEQLFNTTLPSIRTAINDAQYAVGVHGLEALGAE